MFGFNTSETLYTIGDRTTWCNKCFKSINNLRVLKFNSSDFKNRVLLWMKPCCFQIKGDTNGSLFRHK